ncbi:hypothetical protein QNI19_28260 [Cytophagaceae bacterium DM2B3-1]|uniref:Uncharacterized protein n=1 Tax=Xanthocytophaga flava TaxID=3048013 RepID=A0ABT7CT09_9BACT|nr:hypothetical protein [Xanthocytophaga flavus]MDJ1496862.1 hypothetical protein [Xanthocytophaga flavus]
MWSDRYYYLNIYYDKQLSAEVSTSTLITFLQSIPQLMQYGEFEFRNIESFPFTIIFLVRAQSPTSWSDRDTDINKTNLINIVCTKGKKEDFKKIMDVLIPIASFVNWQLVDELTDDEIEDFVLWSPPEKL